MALNEQAREKWENTLRELELITESETISDHTAGDYWWFNSQTRGNLFFMEDRMIFVSGWGVEKITIPYKNIRGMKKCFVGLFIPTGIKLTVYDDEKLKDKTYKFSVLKRKNWMEYLSNKSGVTPM